MSAAPRKSLGRFEIVRVLGKGAMGIVYEGRDPKLNRRVAIKTILRSAIMDEEAARDYAARFVREAQAVARLTHPNIVGVYDFGDEDDVTFIVMEFIDGKELKSYLDAGHRFDFPSTVRIMNELLDGLGYAHRQGVVHRDIKPANIMIDSAGRVKLTDFGVARITESAERTQVGTMVGTPSYMSPEQIQGTSSDNRTDIFACGVILYQMVTGEKPFTGAGTWTIYNQILLEDPTPPTALNSSLPPGVDRVVNKALAKKKEDRYRNAAEMASALTALLLGTPDGESAGEADEDATRFILPSDAARMAESAAQRLADAGSASRPQAPPPAAAASSAQEIELEFWRSIKDSVDPADHELYLQKFPAGVYAELARRKAGRLRDPAGSDSTDPTLRAPRAGGGDPDATQLAGSIPPAPSPASAAPRGMDDPTVAPASSGPSLGLIGGGAAGMAALAIGAWLMLGPDKPASPPVPAPPPQATPAPAPQAPVARPPAQPALPPSSGTANVQPKEDPEAQRRIDSAIERANSGTDAEAARQRAAAEKAAAKAAAERAAAEKAAARAAADRAAAEKAAAERAAAERAATERAAAERAAAERSAAERAAAERAAAERAAAERAAAEKAAIAAKAAAERAAAEKAAAERAAAERVAAEKAAAAKAASIERALAEERAAAANRAAEPAKRAGGRQN